MDDGANSVWSTWFDFKITLLNSSSVLTDERLVTADTRFVNEGPCGLTTDVCKDSIVKSKDTSWSSRPKPKVSSSR